MLWEYYDKRLNVEFSEILALPLTKDYVSFFNTFLSLINDKFLDKRFYDGELFIIFTNYIENIDERLFCANDIFLGII